MRFETEMVRSLLDRFEAKYIPEPMSGCWLWTAKYKECGTGYGIIHIGGRSDGRWHYAHRISWQLLRGDIPDGGHVLHKCDNSICVNPDHLYIGDQPQNNRDRDERGRFVVLRGMDNGHSKLTDDQVREIRASRLSSIKIAPRFCIDPATIRKIRRREVWRHVT